jgi:uncharacterized protein (DUF427 family)
MKAVWNGVTVAESDDTVVVEGNHYFPESALKREYFTFSNHKTTCAWKGQASYLSLLVNGEMNTDAAWFYANPKPEADEIRGRVAFWKGVNSGLVLWAQRLVFLVQPLRVEAKGRFDLVLALVIFHHSPLFAYIYISGFLTLFPNQ